MSRITYNQLPEPVKRGQVHPKDYWVSGTGQASTKTADALCCCAPVLQCTLRGTWPHRHTVSLQNDDYFKQLEPLVAALKEQVPEAKYDGKALVFLLVQLLHFQEGALGKEVSGTSHSQADCAPVWARTPAHLQGWLQQCSTLNSQDATDNRGAQLV